jgi:hypothetical protein
MACLEAAHLRCRRFPRKHLQLLIGLARDWEAGLCRAITESESAALAAYEVALEAIGTAPRHTLSSSSVTPGSV